MAPTIAPPNNSISIVSDVSNAIVPDSLCTQLKATSHLQVVNADNSLPKDCSAAEIASKIGGNYQLLIAAVGVPGDSSYKNRLETLLSAWNILPQKPGMLIVSSTPAQAIQITNSWIEAHTEIWPVRHAIAVNDPYLLMSGRDNVIQQLQNQLLVSQQLNQLLLNSLQTPSTQVRAPIIIPNASVNQLLSH